MRVEIKDFVAGASEARGIAVVIDVFRAFSLAAFAFASGVSRMIPVAPLEDAYRLKAADPEALLVGERYARPVPGADCGNSPTQLAAFDLRGRRLIHCTHAGTQGLCAATGADEVLTGALVNAGAIVRYLRQRAPDHVTLVRMGQHASERCAEDDLCAEVLAARLAGRTFGTNAIAEQLRTAPSAAKFFDSSCDWAPAEDFAFCTQVDRYDFVLRLNRTTAPAILERVDVP
ncbi:MAG: 2-phosphosulfolactate phosphatase [Steroidobacteraceae bacterium]